MVDVWEGVLYSVVRLQKFSGASLQFTVLNPKLYQKLNFMVFQFIIANLSTTNAKNRAVNKPKVRKTVEYGRLAHNNVSIEIIFSQCGYFCLSQLSEKLISKTISRKESRI